MVDLKPNRYITYFSLTGYHFFILLFVVALLFGLINLFMVSFEKRVLVYSNKSCNVIETGIENHTNIYRMKIKCDGVNKPFVIKDSNIANRVNKGLTSIKCTKTTTTVFDRNKYNCEV